MSEPRRIYLDNAATSWPKPPAVYDAVLHAMREIGAGAGRGAYRQASDAERVVGDARRRAARLLGVGDPRNVVFTCNGTDSLNVALHGLLRPGDHVVTTQAEHNSVLRPLRQLQETRDVSVSIVPCDAQGQIDPGDIAAAIGAKTKLVAMIHVSNVTGAILPVEEVGKIAKERKVRFLVDAAQSLGHLPVDAAHIGADLLAAPGHKAMLGPLGTGLLYIAPNLIEDLRPLRQGGTGTQSEDDRQPMSMPDRYESGNHNVPALAGLAASLKWIEEQTLEKLAQHERELTLRLIAGLSEIDGVTVYGPSSAGERVGVVSVNLAGCEPQEVAAMLDSGCAVQVRAGMHCAPRIHRALGTTAAGGTVRFSVGPFLTESDIDDAIAAMEEVASALCA